MKMKSKYIFFLLLMSVSFSYAQTNSILPGQLITEQSSTSGGVKAISGTIANSNVGAFSTGVHALIESPTSPNGYALYATHAGSGWGIRAISASGYGTYTFSTNGKALKVDANQNTGLGLYAVSTSNYPAYFSNINSGVALKTIGGVKLTGTGMNQANGKILRSTNSIGTATWDDFQIYSTNWSTLATAWRDTIIDGTVMKINHLNTSCISTDVLNKGMVKVYFRFGSSTFALPYSSHAGGAANTINYFIQNGRILLSRFTHDVSLNSGLIGISSSLEYRIVIVLPKFDCSTAVISNATVEELSNPCQSTVPCEKSK